MIKIEEVKKELASEHHIVILSHRSPDGDSIGSSLAVYNFLKERGIDSKVITPDPAPAFLNWMSGFSDILNYERKKAKVSKLITDATLFFCLDFNTPMRLGQELQQIVQRNLNSYIINIDHHQEPENFADFQLSDTSASSTAQLVFDFIEALGYKSLINKAIGECIYTGILTDTGSFRFSSTSPRTHRIVADLMEVGVLSSQIHQTVYDNYSLDRLKLLGFALNERFNVYNEFATGIIYLTEKDLNQFNFQKGDTEGLVNYPLSVGTIKISILITEKDGKVKMSFRSKDTIKVNDFAKQYFNGGGHLNAAGGISDVSVLDTVKKLERLLPEFKNQLNA